MNDNITVDYSSVFFILAILMNQNFLKVIAEIKLLQEINDWPAALILWIFIKAFKKHIRKFELNFFFPEILCADKRGDIHK